MEKIGCQDSSQFSSWYLLAPKRPVDCPGSASAVSAHVDKASGQPTRLLAQSICNEM